MIIKTIGIDQAKRDGIQETVRQLLTNTVPHLKLPESITPTIEFKDDHIAVRWEDKIEIPLRGLPDPDVISARIYPHETLLDLRLSNIRIDYS